MPPRRRRCCPHLTRRSIARRWRSRTRAAPWFTGSTAPSTPTRSATCWPSMWTRRRCCRPTTRRTGSTTSPTRWACRPSCSSATWRRPDKISSLAVGDPQIAAGVSDTFRIRQDASQDVHIEGLPIGTVGGILARTTLPLDGDVRSRFDCSAPISASCGAWRTSTNSSSRWTACACTCRNSAAKTTSRPG